MQKVVGSSPIIRSKGPADKHVAFLLLTTQKETLSQNDGGWPESPARKSSPPTVICVSPSA